jgi:hypothetical protein
LLAIVQAIASPKGNLIFGPWQNTEYYLSVGQGFHSNDLRGALRNVDALATEINFQQGNPTVVTQGKTPLLTRAPEPTQGYGAERLLQMSLAERLGNAQQHDVHASGAQRDGQPGRDVYCREVASS